MKTPSQYDQAFIAKDTHDEAGHFVRVADATSVASKYFTHFRTTYNGSDLPTLVNYYQGTTQQRTQFGCTADVASSLAGKYFTFNSAPDNKLYYIYYTVGGVGTNPNLANATGFAVDVTADDPAIVVAAATNFLIQTSLAGIFTTSRTGSVVDVRAVGFGTVDISTAGTTSFVIQSTLGIQETTNSISISYSASNNPIYLGQELKGMYFNVFSGKFEKNNDVTIDNATIDVQLNSANDSVSAVQSGTWNVGVNNFPATQTVAGTVAVSNFPAVQPISDNGSSITVDGTVTVANPGLTDTQLRATALPVSVSNFPASQAVTGTFFQATQPVSAAVLPLPSGAATSANQTTSNISLSSIDSKLSILKVTQTATAQATSFTTAAIDTSVICGKSICIQMINSNQSALFGSQRIQISNDNSNWANVLSTETPISNSNDNTFYDLETAANFVRVSVTVDAGTSNFAYYWVVK